jgi:hypothetical protein
MDTSTLDVILGGVQYVKPTPLAQHVVELMHNVNDIRRYEVWKQLQLVGRVLQSVQEVDLTISFKWLLKGRLSSIDVRNVLAAEEDCLLTRNHPVCIDNIDGTE